MIRAITITISTVALALWLAFLRPQFLGGPTGYVIVSGTSMEPTYHGGDLVITRHDNRYEVGDIVAFRVPKGQEGEGNLVIHRIVGTEGNGYKTKGDNRDSTDSWSPTSDDAIGRAWLRVPYVGDWLNALKQPFSFGLLLSLFMTDGFVQNATRRRRNGRLKMLNNSSAPGSAIPRPSWTSAALIALAVATLAVGFMTWKAYAAPAESTRATSQLLFEQTASFDYVVRVPPSSLYPNGTIGPIKDDADEQTPVAVFSADPPALDLGISYSFLSGGLASEPQVEGTVRTTLEVSSGPHGWHKSLGVVADQPFAGSSVKIRVPVDLTQARELISTIESETGIKASEYELVVATEVHTNGHVGTTAIDEVFRAPFTVIMSKNQFYMDPLLHRSEQRNDERAVTTPQTFDMLGRSLDVKKTRLTSAALLVGLLSATGVGAAVVFLGFGSSEIAKIRARYGSYLVTVKDVQLDPDPTRQIKLATVADLVKLAKRDNRMILHGTVLSGEHIYFIQDGPVTYIYEVAPTPTSTLTKTSEA